MTTTRCWPAGFSSPMTGATSAAARAWLATPCSANWLMSRWGAADDSAGSGAPLPLHRLRARLAQDTSTAAAIRPVGDEIRPAAGCDLTRAY
jgi:alkylhydroperoxidase family enzyme